VVALVRFFGGPKVPNLVGTRKGSVQVHEDVGKELQGKDVPPVAKQFLEALAQKAADKLLGVTIQFKPDGTAIYSGHTPSIGLPGEADGPWEILEEDGDMLVVRMGPANAPFKARLEFRDRDSFTLVRLDKAEVVPMRFSRVKD
jgi:hypothetical protein